eukprot:TRINITY_DN1768_c0_g2_i1.p1 TRINITY_DN1768_c0_g2~~TRINITY_DN1768_c0_g2_i1.p1  ORF type:complete len:275 (-),score=77.31 TRINITY_DN1768_c0_g2_i1:165-989(-)
MLLLTHVESCLADADWVLNQIKVLESVAADDDKEEEEEDKEEEAEEKAPAASSRLFKCSQELFGRLANLLNILDQVTGSQITGPPSELLLRMLATCYKTLVNTTKMLLASKKYPSKKYLRLVEFSCKNLTRHVYALILHLQSNQAGDAEATKFKIVRERRLIPNLIFQLEQHEHMMIKLSKITKVDLSRWMKRSTARDFRINLEELSRRSGNDKDKDKDKEDGSDEDETPKSKNKKRKSKGEGEEEDNGSEGETARGDEPDQGGKSQKAKKSRR